MFFILQVFGNNPGHFGVEGILKCYLWDSKHQLWTLLLVSTYNLVCLNFERWFSIKFPFNHRTILKKRHIIITCITIWLLWIAYDKARFVATTKITDDGICKWHVVWPDNPFWYDFGWSANMVIWFIIPSVCLLFTNFSILLHIKRRNVAWQKNRENDSDQPEPGKSDGNVTKKAAIDAKAAKVEMNILKTLISVSAAFGLCWVWNIIWTMAYTAKLEFSNNAVYYDFSVMLMFCNVCVNPFLYSAQYKQFQDQAKKLFCGCCVKDEPQSPASRRTEVSSVSQ